MTPRLFVLTPLRDEAENIPKLAESVRAQTRPIDGWIILENGSTDGSKELLAELEPGGAVRDIVVLSLDMNQSYTDGWWRYASIVDAGLDYLFKHFEFEDDDMVALLDADTFVPGDYYAILEDVFRSDPKIGMACGAAIRPGQPRNVTRWTGGGYYVWRYACLAQAGYPVVPSPDIVCAVKAHLLGWKLKIVEATYAETRGQGRRVDFRKFGRSAYYRGETLLHCLARSGRLVARGRFHHAFGHASGYVGDLVRRAPRIEDEEIRQYFGETISRRLKELWASRRKQADEIG
jgi:glycosyltransferase involved in cell wall biosynthesis